MAYAVMMTSPLRPQIIAIGSTGQETLELVMGRFTKVPTREEQMSLLKACRVSLNACDMASVPFDFLGMTLYVQNVL